MGTLVLSRGRKTRRTISVGVKTTLAVAGTIVIQTELNLELESEVSVSCWTVDRVVPEEDDISIILPTTKAAQSQQTDAPRLNICPTTPSTRLSSVSYEKRLARRVQWSMQVELP